MTDFLEDPIPDIHISQENAQERPLSQFQLIVIVEPDPEKYLLMPQNEEALDMVLDHLVEAFDDELTLVELAEPEEGLNRPRLAWLSYEADDYFMAFIEDNPVDVYFRLESAANLEAFQDYLTGAARNHPDWQVAVIGGMYEDDVVRVAGMVQEAGLHTMVLTRYCLSKTNFVDLFELTEEERDRLLDELEEAEGEAWEEYDELLDEDEQ